MDDGAHRENGRHKQQQQHQQQQQNQWLMQHQPSMKQIMAIMAERDAAIQERNLAISEKKAALAERDMAILQRDSAISERNNAIMERDNALATLQYRENAMKNGNMTPQCPPSCQMSRGIKHIHHPEQHVHHHVHHQPHIGEASYTAGDCLNETIPMSPAAEPPPPPAKSKRSKRAKEAKPSSKKGTKRVKREAEDLNATFGEQKNDWKDQDLGLNQVAFDDSTMPVPVCSCTGVLRPCYKWGQGGWQSSCCTTNLSMHPLPAVPNKRHARIGGRKMSGSVFSKLLSRLAAEGHDLSNPVDLKDHWAKHGTNRYITIK